MFIFFGSRPKRQVPKVIDSNGKTAVDIGSCSSEGVDTDIQKLMFKFVSLFPLNCTNRINYKKGSTFTFHDRKFQYLIERKRKEYKLREREHDLSKEGAKSRIREVTCF